MRGILINPFDRTVTEIETNGRLDDMRRLIDCEYITVSMVTAANALILDDEGLLVERERQAYFKWDGVDQPFAGRGLILGTDDEGENADTDLPLTVVKASVTWLDRETVEPDDWTGFDVHFF